MSDGPPKVPPKPSTPPPPSSPPARRPSADGPSRDAAFHFAAGLGSGLLSAVLLQPVELLKTRVQQAGHHSLAATLAEIRLAPGAAPPSAARTVRRLWRGTAPSALRTGFGSAVYFASLNSIRQHAARVPSLAGAPAATTTPGSGGGGSSSLVQLSPTGNLLAGAAARTFAGLLLMPLTVVKVRYESSLYGYGSVAGACRAIWRAEGARGFFAGFGATALRDGPYAGSYVLFYELAKARLGAALGPGPGDGDGAAGMAGRRAAAVHFASGVLAAATCSVLSNPFDAVKTRIQLQPADYRNIWQAAGLMWRERGPRAFMDGLALRMSRKALSSALAWTLYEELIRRAEVSWQRAGSRDETVL